VYVSKYSEDLASDSRQAAQEAINERTKALEKQGLTFDYLAKKLKRELNAKETKFFQKDGFVIEQHDVVAWDVRQRARIDAHKLRGDYPAEKREHTHSITGSLIDDLMAAKEKAHGGK
jgi:hypothetical protein